MILLCRNGFVLSPYNHSPFLVRKQEVLTNTGDVISTLHHRFVANRWEFLSEQA
jgi:hypothetical protein